MTVEGDAVRLGQSGLTVSALGFGTWAWGEGTTWGYGASFDESDLRRAFAVALERGVTLFDTAELYSRGLSERLLGRFIREQRAGDRIVVATKYMPYPWRLGKRRLHESIKQSMNRLGLATLGLYQIHRPLPPARIDSWMDALADAVAEGLIRAVGVSNFNAAQTRAAHAALARRGVPLASNQVRYHLLHRWPEHNGVLQTCRELGVTVIAYSPLCLGVLTGKYTPESPPPGPRQRRYGRTLLNQVGPLLEALSELGRRHAGTSPAQVALNWALRQGVLPIPGVKNAQQAEDNAGALGWRLDDSDLAILDLLSGPFHK